MMWAFLRLPSSPNLGSTWNICNRRYPLAVAIHKPIKKMAVACYVDATPSGSPHNALNFTSRATSTWNFLGEQGVFNLAFPPRNQDTSIGQCSHYCIRIRVVHVVLLILVFHVDLRMTMEGGILQQNNPLTCIFPNAPIATSGGSNMGCVYVPPIYTIFG